MGYSLAMSTNPYITLRDLIETWPGQEPTQFEEWPRAWARFREQIVELMPDSASLRELDDTFRSICEFADRFDPEGDYWGSGARPDYADPLVADERVRHAERVKQSIERAMALLTSLGRQYGVHVEARRPKLADRHELLDVKEVAEMLRKSPRHIERLCDAGTMPRPVTPPQKKRFWRKGDIESWIKDGCPDMRRRSPRRGAR